MSGVGIGVTLANRYVVKREIARGGMCVVFEATHSFTDRSVALKLLHSQSLRDPTCHERLLREAKVLASVRHPNVVEVLDAGTSEDDGPFVVMEMLEGRTLDGILAAKRQLSVPATVHIARQMGEALAFAHSRNVMHRDLKPSNLFVARSPRGEILKIIDFGIAGLRNEATPTPDRKLTKHGEILGTPEYMAPEQLLAKPDVDHRCDIYSLGVVLFECLTGKPPFEGSYPELLMKVNTQPAPSALSVRPDIGPGLAAIIDTALATSPDRRFPDASALLRALDEISSATPAPAHPSAPVAPAKPETTDLTQAAAEAANPRRRFARAPYVTPIRYIQSDGTVIDGRSEDISAGGLLVYVAQPCRNNDQGKVRIALPITGRVVTLPVICRWGRSTRGRATAGLEFVDLPTEAQQPIAQYVQMMSRS